MIAPPTAACRHAWRASRALRTARALLSPAWLPVALALVTPALVAPALVAPALVAQERPPAARQLADDETQHFDAVTNAALQRLLEAALADRLPDAPLRNRMRQGAARGVPGTRVLALVRAHADSMRAARSALGTHASADELDAGAAALHAGATRAVLRQLRAARPTGATTALVVLTDLLWRGVPAPAAEEVITSVAERSPDRALLTLQGTVAREGAPTSRQRWQALVDRVAPRDPPHPRDGPLARDGTSPGNAADGIPLSARVAGPRDTTADRRTGHPGHLSVSSLSAPAHETLQAVHVDAGWRLPLRGWELSPSAAVRAAEQTRWGLALDVARSFRPGRQTTARLWLASEWRTSDGGRDALPVETGLGSTALPTRQPTDLLVLGGTELQRNVGRWSVGTSLALGHSRFSRLESRLVARPGAPVLDTSTSRPDTLRPVVTWETVTGWRALRGTTVRGALSVQRGPYRLEGGVSRQLAAVRPARDSVTPAPRVLMTVAAARRLTPWLSLEGQWASRDPSRVAGTLALNDAKWRLGLRFAEPGRAAPRPPTMAGAGGSGNAGSTDEAPAHAAVRADSSWTDERGEPRYRVIVEVTVAEVRLLESNAPVHVEGDVTGWRVMPLAPAAPRRFRGTFVASSAVVRLRVRVGDGPWLIPAGGAVQRDDFGEEVAVYVIEG